MIDDYDAMRARAESAERALAQARAALEGLLGLYDWDDPAATFEALAEAFYAETGTMAPGKSVPLEWAGRWSDEERRERYDTWIKRRGKAIRKQARALLDTPA